MAAGKLAHDDGLCQLLIAVQKYVDLSSLKVTFAARAAFSEAG